MKYICEERDGKIWVRGKCCIDRKTGKFREDYSGWIVKDITVPTPNVLCDEKGHLIWEVVENIVVVGISPLTAKEQAESDSRLAAESMKEQLPDLVRQCLESVQVLTDKVNLQEEKLDELSRTTVAPEPK